MQWMSRGTVAVVAVITWTTGGSNRIGAQESAPEEPPRWGIGIGAGGFGTITHEIREARSSPLVALRVDRSIGRYVVVDGRLGYTRVALRPSAAPGYDLEARPTTHLELLDLTLQVQLPGGRFRPYVGAGGGIMHDGAVHEGSKFLDFTVVTGGARVDLSANYSAAAGLRFRNGGEALRNWDWEIGLSRRF